VADLRTERFRTAGGFTDFAATAMAVVAMLGHPIAFAAEAVETEDPVTALLSLGCDGAQGYLVGRPRTAETLFGPERL
jgi:EAL domain-containing protein (putative c-di-GMP-specific phosphodiesterase class I)